jgi:CheY-like chemotaxis protein
VANACRSILVIEDDHDTRVSIRRALEAEGYFVFSATNGVGGLETLQRIKPPGLILLDLMMPLMNGQDFLKAKEADPEIAEIPVIVMSANRDFSNTVRVDRFLKKPLDLDLILEAVREYCVKLSR